MDRKEKREQWKELKPRFIELSRKWEQLYLEAKQQKKNLGVVEGKTIEELDAINTEFSSLYKNVGYYQDGGRSTKSLMDSQMNRALKMVNDLRKYSN